MADSKVKVSGSLDFPFWVIPKHEDKILERTAVVRVEAPPAKKRASIDLVVVLNISTQLMAPSVLDHLKAPSVLDHLKETMKFVITKLDDGDCLSIVAFNNLSNSYTTETIKISRESRMSDKQKVDGLVAGGHSGSRSGLMKHAVEVLDARSERTRQGFIILVSDGLDNSESSTRLLRQYPVHTMGLGKAHDPMELYLIAKESNGTYSSITEGLSSKIMEAFAVCLAGLKSVVAIDARIQIKGKQSPKTCNVTTVIDSRSFGGEEDSGKIVLGVLYAGEVKDLVVSINFTVKETSGFSSIDLLTATVSYKDVQSNLSDKQVLGTLQVKVCATSFANDCTNEATPFPMVLHQKARLKVLKFMDGFKGELAKMSKDPGLSAADQGKVDRPTLQKTAAFRLEETWKEFKKTKDYSPWNEAQKFGVDLGRIDSSIDAMLSCMRRASGLGCVYSWVLSCEMQRAAFTGLPATTMFLTTKMKEMVQEAQALAQAEEDATTSSATAAGRVHLAPPGERLVEALEEIVKGVLERSGGGAVPTPNTAGT